jgi:hypothetical protein
MRVLTVFVCSAKRAVVTMVNFNCLLSYGTSASGAGAGKSRIILVGRSRSKRRFRLQAPASLIFNQKNYGTYFTN